MAEAGIPIILSVSRLFENVESLSLGCSTLDTLFGGTGRGLPLSSGITEIAGESSAGKSQWAMMLAVRVCQPSERVEECSIFW